MSIEYNVFNHPFDEIKFIDYHNQLIVKKNSIDSNYTYIYNFHMDVCRDENVINCVPGMTYLFNLNRGYYYVKLNGTNDNDFSLLFTIMSQEQINDFKNNQSNNTDNYTSNSINHNDVNFSISSIP
jgi:hypothetical protein